MNRRILMLAAAAAAGLLATGLLMAGCNSGDDGGGGYKPPPTTILDVEPGKWQVTGRLIPQTSGCPQVQPVQMSGTYCNGIDLAQQARGLGLDCTFTINGDRIEGTCSGTYGGAIDYNGTVTGSVASNGRSVSASGLLNLTGGEGEEQTLCTYALTIDGAWQEPGSCGSAQAGVERAGTAYGGRVEDD